MGLAVAGLANAEVGDDAALGWVVALAQTAGIVLLIWGGVQLMAGRGRGVFLAGAVLELLICAYYLISFLAMDTGGIGVVEDAKSVIVLAALLFAVMPAVGLFPAMGSATTEYLRSRRR